MTQFTAPAQPLTDGVVTPRLPSPAGDIDTVCGYVEHEQLDGGWLPEIPLVSAEQAIGDWLNAWAGHPSRNGPTFVVTVPQEAQFIGIVGLKDRGEGAVEMIYGDRAALARTRPGQPRRVAGSCGPTRARDGTVGLPEPIPDVTAGRRLLAARV